MFSFKPTTVLAKFMAIFRTETLIWPGFISRCLAGRLTVLNKPVMNNYCQEFHF
jgi:hypothetical protein